MNQILCRIRFAGNKQAVPISELHAADLGYISRRKYVIRLGDTIRSIALRDPLMGDAALWTLIARINNLMTAVDPSGAPIVQLRRGQVIHLPNPHEIDQHKLLGKFATITQTVGKFGAPGSRSNSHALPAAPAPESQPAISSAPPVQLPAPPHAIEEASQEPLEQSSVEVEARMFIQRLAGNCRIMSADVPSDEFVCSIRLQADIDGRWTTIASYDCVLNWASRFVYHPDGRREHLDLDLPVAVVKEMAKEDFLRNWASYTQQYAQDFPQNGQRLA